MKKLPLLAALCLCLAVLSGRAGAYDYRADRLEDDPGAQSIYAMESDLASFLDGEVRFDRAVRVYMFQAEEFLDALKAGMAQALDSCERTVWEVPVALDQGAGYASMTETGFSSARSDVPMDDRPYLFDPQTMTELLEGRSFDSVYIASVPRWYANFVAVLDGDEVRLAPFASRPEFWEAENGRWYTVEEMYPICFAFQQELTAGPGDHNGGGGAQGSVLFGLAAAGGGLALLLGGLAVLRRRKGVGQYSRHT